MKKLVFLFLSLLTAGSLFQACDNSKTYAEMLEEENVSYLLVKQKLMEILKNKQKYLKNMKKSGKISANSLIFELIEKYERKNNS